ncbi:MAG: UvrB/UvrC motif-containing protein [Pirellulaceae bacterium]|nr:UvrB/UvrC motif-containing protein [Pirellulaceae bacterium]
MKCQRCEKPSTFHITEIIGEEIHEFHLCEDHAKEYMANVPPSDNTPPSTPDDSPFESSVQIQLPQSQDELEKLDQETCPICGISFYEFRQKGRFGCPYDYIHFQKELEPLLANIHGVFKHTGKRPKRMAQSSGKQTELISLRREMQQAIEKELYEKASQIRDRIRQLETS